MLKFVTSENLQFYHKTLMEHLKNPHLVATNICPQCGGVISHTDECEYCGAKLKLVVDKWEV